MMLFSEEPLKVPTAAFTTRLDKFLKQKRMSLKVDYPMIDTFPHGSPLGGFGTGTFSRTPSGDFSVWHLFPGVHIYENIKTANLAVYQKYKNKVFATALNCGKDKIPKSWREFSSDKKVLYQALYPKSWYTYKGLPAEVIVEQFSPVLPNNYRETSYPAACFNVQVRNRQKEEVEISFLFSFQNILGWSYEKVEAESSSNYNFLQNRCRTQNKRVEEYDIKALVFSGKSQLSNALSGQICLAVEEIEGAKVFFRSVYDGNGDGHEVWDDFSRNGTLVDANREDVVSKAGAVAVKIIVAPGQTIKIPFVLCWDIPRVLHHYRYYTKYFGKDGQQAFNIAKELLTNFKKLSEKIDSWQSETLDNKKIPKNIKTMLFNELYYLADGGSLWDQETGRFTYLECYDYCFYETLDVRYYGAFPLAKFWPEIEKKIMLDFVRTAEEEDRTMINYHTSLTANEVNLVAGEKISKFIQKDFRKRKFTMPHDIGSPFEAVWEKLNAYTWQNSNRWKDLNSKFVLMVYRAYYYDGKKDKEFLEKCWSTIEKVLEYQDAMLDKDKDFLPENEDFPDQTFDNWTMKGTSAYCGILKVAAMQAAIQIAEILGHREQALTLRRSLKNGQDSLYKKLWNGSYFNFDEISADIMSAQLMGQWYLDQFHLPGIIEDNQVRDILKLIYKTNYRSFTRGSKGLVNGRTPEGGAVSCSQGNDVWLGVNFAFAAHLLKFNMKKEAEKILKTIYKNIYKRGFLFRTPESWDKNDKFIATMYMRPGAVWAVADYY